jgi:uncharacterized protein (UPF0276 family)
MVDLTNLPKQRDQEWRIAGVDAQANPHLSMDTHSGSASCKIG